MMRRGFTVIEILVVIAIIAILVAILLPVFSAARRHVNEAKCQTQLVQFSHAIESYRQDVGMYPPGNPSMALRQAKKLADILTCPLDPKKKDNSDTYSLLYNYYGYQDDGTLQPVRNKTRAEANAAYTPITSTTIAGALYWRSDAGILDGSPDSDFPGLFNPNPPRNTIVTICPYHTGDKGKYMILRVDGSVDFAAPTDSTFWMLSEKINK